MKTQKINAFVFWRYHNNCSPHYFLVTEFNTILGVQFGVVLRLLIPWFHVSFSLISSHMWSLLIRIHFHRISIIIDDQSLSHWIFILLTIIGIENLHKGNFKYLFLIIVVLQAFSIYFYFMILDSWSFEACVHGYKHLILTSVWPLNQYFREYSQ